MSSQKLKKYLAYYQKTLREDPSNIEARLRLAAIFRDMGRISHAVEEYVAVSKLLASQGLALEAIAACKAVLELEPTHTETQFFLARLYAQVPEATGDRGRVARPVDETVRSSRPANEESGVRTPAPGSTTAVKVRSLDASDSGLGHELGAIMLGQPKGEAAPAGRQSDSQAGRQPAPEIRHRDETPVRLESVARELAVESVTRVAGAGELVDIELLRQTSEQDAVSEDTAEYGDDDDDQSHTSPLPTQEVPLFDEITNEEIFVTQKLSAASRNPAGPSASMSSQDLRSTVDVDVADILEATVAGRGPEIPDDEFSAHEAAHEQTFAIGVFDMASLALDDPGAHSWKDLSFLDDLDEPSSVELRADNLAAMTHPSILSVSRARLPEIPLFSALSPNAFMELLRVMNVCEFPAQATIIAPESVDSNLYVIVKGRVRVTKETRTGLDVTLAILGEGDFFGEFRLLTGNNGMAAVVAHTDVELLEVRDEVIFELAGRHPQLWDELWRIYYTRMLNNLLATSRIFGSLSAPEREHLAQGFRLKETVAGDVIHQQGAPCHELCLVVHGEVEITRKHNGRSELAAVLREGDFFGVTPGALQEPCTATARVTTDTALLCLPATEFRRMIQRHDGVAHEVDRLIRQRRG